eukprot:863515-Prymnesium_polylepis.1
MSAKADPHVPGSSRVPPSPVVRYGTVTTTPSTEHRASIQSKRELGACASIARATESARVVASASGEHEGAHTGQGRSQRIDL